MELPNWWRNATQTVAKIYYSFHINVWPSRLMYMVFYGWELGWRQQVQDLHLIRPPLFLDCRNDSQSVAMFQSAISRQHDLGQSGIEDENRKKSCHFTETTRTAQYRVGSPEWSHDRYSRRCATLSRTWWKKDPSLGLPDGVRIFSVLMSQRERERETLIKYRVSGKSPWVSSKQTYRVLQIN